MYERFTERAREVVILAQDEARALKHNYIGAEHILAGLLLEKEGLAARILDSFEITIGDLRDWIKDEIGEDSEIVVGQIPFTPRAKKVHELALREAIALGHNYIGTEHILLGIVRESENMAMKFLTYKGITGDNIRSGIIRMLSSKKPAPPQPLDDAFLILKETQLHLKRLELALLRLQKDES